MLRLPSVTPGDHVAPELLARTRLPPRRLLGYWWFRLGVGLVALNARSSRRRRGRLEGPPVVRARLRVGRERRVAAQLYHFRRRHPARARVLRPRVDPFDLRLGFDLDQMLARGQAGPPRHLVGGNSFRGPHGPGRPWIRFDRLCRGLIVVERFEADLADAAAASDRIGFGAAREEAATGAPAKNLLGVCGVTLTPTGRDAEAEPS